MDIGNMIERATGGGDEQSLGQAAEQHLGDMTPEDVNQHLQTAADNANQNGQPDVAQEIEGMISRKQADPEELKTAAVDYIKRNPQVLTHFAPSFAQGLLNRL